MLKSAAVLFVAIVLLMAYPLYCGAQVTNSISKKTTSIIARLLAANDPAQFAKSNNIELKDDMIKVVILVNERLLPKDFSIKYNLRGFKSKNNTVSAYVKLDMLKKMCEEKGVTFIRTPFKLRPLFK